MAWTRESYESVAVYHFATIDRLCGLHRAQISHWHVSPLSTHTRTHARAGTSVGRGLLSSQNGGPWDKTSWKPLLYVIKWTAHLPQSLPVSFADRDLSFTGVTVMPSQPHFPLFSIFQNDAVGVRLRVEGILRLIYCSISSRVSSSLWVTTCSLISLKQIKNNHLCKVQFVEKSEGIFFTCFYSWK